MCFICFNSLSFNSSCFGVSMCSCSISTSISFNCCIIFAPNWWSFLSATTFGVPWGIGSRCNSSSSNRVTRFLLIMTRRWSESLCLLTLHSLVQSSFWWFYCIEACQYFLIFWCWLFLSLWLSFSSSAVRCPGCSTADPQSSNPFFEECPAAFTLNAALSDPCDDRAGIEWFTTSFHHHGRVWQIIIKIIITNNIILW